MGKFEFWTVAYRRRGGTGTILDDASVRFTAIPNTWRYWRADPFLFEESGHTYIFAEMYDRLLRRGVIGCCELGPEGPGKWRVVLKRPFHLSYPFVFRHGESVFMMPESYMAGEIGVYRAVGFPWSWERMGAAAENITAVDPTPFVYGDGLYLLAQRFDDSGERLVFCGLSDSLTADDIRLARPGDETQARPGGRIFAWNGKLVRPSQDCAGSYGRALNFSEITDAGESGFSEKLIRSITPDTISSDLRFPPCGMHTYNLSQSYEVVDLKGYETDPLYTVTRPFWAVWRRLKKLFGA